MPLLLASTARSAQNGLISDKKFNANYSESSTFIASDEKNNKMDDAEQIQNGESNKRTKRKRNSNNEPKNHNKRI